MSDADLARRLIPRPAVLIHDRQIAIDHCVPGTWPRG